MKYCLFTLSFLILSHSFSQTETNKKRSIYFELAGSGGIASINFEKEFLIKPKSTFVWRTGLSFAPIDKNNGTGIVFPFMVHWIKGENAHKLDIGIGQGVTITTRGSFFALTTACIGYRYQTPSKKWFYRVAYTPLISYLIDFQIQHWGGISIGYTLNNKKQ